VRRTAVGHRGSRINDHTPSAAFSEAYAEVLLTASTPVRILAEGLLDLYRQAGQLAIDGQNAYVGSAQWETLHVRRAEARGAFLEAARDELGVDATVFLQTVGHSRPTSGRGAH
jgi:hypothetical protein